MFAYCTEALHLSEGEAYLRIAVARASREHPALLAMLADGRLHLSGIALLAPHLTAENHQTLLQRAAHQSKRQIEELIASVAPRPDAPSLMRRLPVRANPTTLSAPATTPPVAVPSTPSAEPTPSEMGKTVTPCPGHSLALSRGASSSSGPPSPHPPPSPPVVQPLAPGRYKESFAFL